MTQPDFAAIRARAQTALPACYDPHRTTIVLSVAEVNALLAAIDELTAQLRALQSWAEGARTDLAELTAQRDKLRVVAEKATELRAVYNADGDGLRWDIAYAAGALFGALDD